MGRGDGPIRRRARAELWTAARAAAADRHTMDTLGLPSPVLMERAALAVTREIEALWAGAAAPIAGVYVVCGPGNNGGDGVAIARILHARGLRVEAHLVTERRNAAVEEQLAWAVAQGVPVRSGPLPGGREGGAWIVVDALLGTGSKGAPRGAIGAAVAWINDGVAGFTGPRVAVDAPTGVDPDTGIIAGAAARADVTVTFERSKPGLHITPGRAHAGVVVVAEIGLVAPAPGEDTRLVDPLEVRASLASLPPGRHKGERGHVAILGGSAGTPGAAVLVGAAALRCGAGLVTVLSSDPEVQAQLLAHRPELMVRAPERSGPLAPEARALVIGPGLTVAADRAGLATLYRDDPRPAVWDASALDEVPVAGEATAGPRVITPHPGEAARLLARADTSPWTAARVQAERLAAARALAQATAAIVVLKGEGSIVVAGDATWVSIAGGPGLATAGSGDCLAGVIGALLARGLPGPAAARAGVHVHGVAGEAAIRRRPGAVAMDIADLAGEFVRAVDTHPRWPRLVRG
ncbi:MAG: NAD(P)H-hydrate dehydratase [Nannocystaceae bacterium]